MLFSTLFRAVQTSGSVVVPLPGVEVRIVDPISGVDVVPGLDGEIWLKGSAITPDYRHDSEQTGRLFVGEWFRSGYLGRLNKDGCIYLAGNLGVQNECCD